MPAREKTKQGLGPAAILVEADNKKPSIPIWLARNTGWMSRAALTSVQKNWIQAHGFKGNAKRHILFPGADGAPAGVALGLGEARPDDPMDRPELALGLLAAVLPSALYHLADSDLQPELAMVAWGLGAYRYRRYKSDHKEDAPQLKASPGANYASALSILEGVWLGRDLINTPASDLGPQELEDTARELAKSHGAAVMSIVGDDLLTRNFPMIHAVGRASSRPPRLIDVTWGREGSKRVTLVGKGICFDTGGLDLKPASAMQIMKKDMGGAAAALALGHMLMAAGLDVRLRILIPAAENSVSGSAFRPGDVLRSRAGKTVEIGNTDAEGRLVLADALALADEESPDILATFSTLTGAARIALGPDLPALYADNDDFAVRICQAGSRVGDPVWRMPFWSGYEPALDSSVADMNNVSDGPFAGSVTAALFLRRFVRKAKRFAHFDIYGWRPAAKPLGAKGGEIQAARAMFELLRHSGEPRKA